MIFKILVKGRHKKRSNECFIDSSIHLLDLDIFDNSLAALTNSRMSVSYRNPERDTGSLADYLNYYEGQIPKFLLLIQNANNGSHSMPQGKNSKDICIKPKE